MKLDDEEVDVVGLGTVSDGIYRYGFGSCAVSMFVRYHVLTITIALLLFSIYMRTLV